MGDARRPKKKYETPIHPWQKARIDDERELTRTYGTVNKKEIWKMATVLKRAKDQVKKLTPLSSKQADKETQQLHAKLVAYGLLQPNQELDAALGVELKDVMERRLQTLVFRKGLARSAKQARQFITHGHILINGKKMTSPSYLVRTGEEDTLQFRSGSELFRDDHPERVPIQKKAPKPRKEVKRDRRKMRRYATKTTPAKA